MNMIKLFDRNSTKLTISEFYENHEQKKYNFDVDYQRKSGVWTDDKRSFLIDSILKNYPMPPIFMGPNVDTASGRTRYDIVDGKQRLQSIIDFIKNKIPLTSYFFEDDIFANKTNSDIEKEISGKYFKDIKQDQRFDSYIRQFWTYSINIDYLYENSEILISNIFDRLNRNGEPLTKQELRNARYHNSELMKVIRELADNDYWKERFSRLKIERMEDEEFISELFFLTAENHFVDSSPDEIDKLYKRYSEKDEPSLKKIEKKFLKNTQFILNLSIDYNKLKRLNWTTHLYGLYSIAWHCTQNNIVAKEIKNSLTQLYINYFDWKSSQYTGDLLEYKNSCSSRTRSKDQREKRLKAILNYCKVDSI